MKWNLSLKIERPFIVLQHRGKHASQSNEVLDSSLGELCGTIAETQCEIKAALIKILDQTLRTNLRLHDLKNRLQVIEQDQEDLRFQVQALAQGRDKAEIMEVPKRLKKYHRWNDMVRPVDATDNHPDYGDILDKSTIQLGSAWAPSERLKLD